MSAGLMIVGCGSLHTVVTRGSEDPPTPGNPRTTGAPGGAANTSYRIRDADFRAKPAAITTSRAAHGAAPPHAGSRRVSVRSSRRDLTDTKLYVSACESVGYTVGNSEGHRGLVLATFTTGGTPAQQRFLVVQGS